MGEIVIAAWENSDAVNTVTKKLEKWLLLITWKTDHGYNDILSFE